VKGTSHDLYRSGSRGSATSLAIVLLLFAATAAGVAWVGMGIVASDRWPIRWLELNGSFQRVSAEQLRSSLTPHMDASFFTIDLRQLNRSARRIPWVSSVRIRKQWPDTVSVSIEEYRPVAHWNEGELISASGEAFAVPGADDIQGLPWLRGPESRLDEVVAAWGEFNELMMPLALEIGRLQLDRRGAWSMTLTNGTQIRLGRDDATARLERLLTSWEVLMAGREQAPRDIDLRYTNGFAVAWPQDPEKQAGAES
jgi:cell division protein FtsQ